MQNPFSQKSRKTLLLEMRKHRPWIIALAAMGLGGVAQANLSTSLNPAAVKICSALTEFTQSGFVAMIGAGMFVIGGIMWWMKQRGGFAMMVGGLVGYYVVKQLVPIAKGFGIVPSSVC